MRDERRNPFRSSLLIEPMGRRLALAGLAVVAYAAAFVPLYGLSGVGVLGLSIFPVVVLAWLFGAWGGLLSGALSVAVNALLLDAVGEPGWAIVAGEGGLEGSALVVVVGCVIGLLRDLGLRLDRHLTEWRSAERALRDTEDRYRILFERSRDPLFVCRPDGGVVEANDALVRLFGYGRSDLLDVDLAILYQDPADRDRLNREIERMGWVEDFPMRMRTKAGVVRDCLVTATTRRGSSREVVGYQGSIRDVSESAALHELADRRTRELQGAVADLEAFTYSVSHDLRTHLVTLGGFSSILWSDHKDQFEPRAQEYLRRIVDASRRMDRFIQDLLVYSRVSRATVELQTVDLSEIVESVRNTLAGTIVERGGSVLVEGELPDVEADRTLMERVMENLVSNAVKFVPLERAPDVRVRARPLESHVRIEVEDNGIGIDPDDQSRAFRPFERLHPGRFPGTGVGLSIIQKAMERMGGESGVTSEPGRGSTFWVLLRASPTRGVGGIRHQPELHESVLGPGSRR